MQGIQGRSRSRLLQVLDNAANERLGLARRVKIFEKLSRKVSGTNCHLPTISKIANNKPFSLTIKRTLKNFHEIFGLTVQPMKPFFRQCLLKKLPCLCSLHRNLRTWSMLIPLLVCGFHEFSWPYPETSTTFQDRPSAYQGSSLAGFLYFCPVSLKA